MLDEGIDIKVTSRYLKEHSDPPNRRFAFAYSVDIVNRGDVGVKLINRHWQIRDDNNHVEEVKGEGVVGQQPVIEPGQTFHYTSGAIIATEFGTMQGSYEMVRQDGVKFETPIPAFLLSRPYTVH
ncbi:MAG: Co2+/Mg2+ efflux protein ApaG [Pseudohongiellaceae bacterium]